MLKNALTEARLIVNITFPFYLYALITNLKIFKADTEEVIYDSLLNWCRHNDKWTRFPTLAKFIRFDLLSIKYLLHRFKTIQITYHWSSVC